jgi:hypothetical protein
METREARQTARMFSLLIVFEERLMLLQVLEVACRGVNLVMRLLHQKNA